MASQGGVEASLRPFILPVQLPLQQLLLLGFGINLLLAGTELGAPVLLDFVIAIEFAGPVYYFLVFIGGAQRFTGLYPVFKRLFFVVIIFAGGGNGLFNPLVFIL